MNIESSGRNRRCGLAAVMALLLLAVPVRASILFTNVETVNVTAAGFSVVAAVSGAALNPSATYLSVFADPGGATNLAGQVGLEAYPLNAGDPTATNTYQTLVSENNLRLGAIAQGLVYVRVSGCAPGTTYYYRITATNASGGSASWPAGGPLTAVTTAQPNSFLPQSEQLLITVGSGYPAGSIVTLTATNSSSVLAAVVGDGTANDQVFFSLNDLIAAAGGTNLSPTGSVTFAAAVVDHQAAELTQSYTVAFTTNFSVGQATTGTIGSLVAAISIGTGVMRAGTTSSVPVLLNAQSGLVGLSFVLAMPTNLFTAISLVPSVPSVGGTGVQLLTPNTVRLTFTAASGMNLLGNQQIAQLNLTAVSNQPSAFVSLTPQTPLGTNADSSSVAQFSLQGGREVIVGSRSLLELQEQSGNLNLTLYGIPGQSYQIQTSSNLASATTWSNYLLVPVTNLSTIFSSVGAARPAVFYRAYSFNADPPILQAQTVSSGRSMLAYGIPSTNYTLLSASNLTGAVWSPVLSYTLTNSFQNLTNLGSGSPVFYRLKR